jgi:hypothetical protein
MHIQESHRQTAAVSSDGNGRIGAVGTVGSVGSAGAGSAVGTTVGSGGGARSAPLRVDAQRNLEHVLRAAREVFGELGYGAPMEDVSGSARCTGGSRARTCWCAG